MKKLNPKVRVDVEAEITAMATYITARYDNLPDPVALFKRVLAAVVADGPLWFTEHPVFEAVLARIERRKTLLATIGLDETEVRRYDAPCQLLQNLPMAFKQVHEMAQELTSERDYSKRMRTAYNAVVRDFPELPTVLPKGWSEALKHYEEHDDMHKYAVNGQRKDEAAFTGVDSSGACSGGFTNRTALTSVMYDDREQNRKAPFAFMSAVYSHLAAVHEHNNTFDLVAAFEKVDLGDTVPELRFDLPADLTTGHPSLDTVVERALKHCSSAKDLRRMKASFEAADRKRAKMTPEELAADEAETKERMKSIFGTLLSRKPDPEAEKRYQAEEAATRASLATKAAASGIKAK